VSGRWEVPSYSFNLTRYGRRRLAARSRRLWHPAFRGQAPSAYAGSLARTTRASPQKASGFEFSVFHVLSSSVFMIACCRWTRRWRTAKLQPVMLGFAAWGSCPGPGWKTRAGASTV